MGKEWNQIKIRHKTYQKMNTFMEIGETPDKFIDRLLDIHRDSLWSKTEQPMPSEETTEPKTVVATETTEEKEEPLKLIPMSEYEQMLAVKERGDNRLKTWVLTVLGIGIPIVVIFYLLYSLM